MTLQDESLFLQEKPVAIIVAIRRDRHESYAGNLSKKVDTTYSHAVKTIQTLEDKGYITSRKEGRKKILELTEEGAKVADLFGEVLTVTDGRASEPLLA